VAKKIVIWPEKVLTTAAQPVTEFGEKLEPLLAELLESVKEAEGIGIAAPQIGVPLRLALVGREDGTFFEIANPKILEQSEEVSLREGCLSVPGEYDQCPRFRKVRVRYQDKTGAWQEQVAEDRLAHVFQHEIDHLEGTVFVMRLSALKRDLMRNKMKKLKRYEKDA
jgi:peptide deformylase